VTKLSPAMRLVIRIGSGLLVAAVIAIALTMPAPAFDERLRDHDGSLSHFGHQPARVLDHSMVDSNCPHCELSRSSPRTGL